MSCAHTHPQDMLQDEAQRGAARVRQVEDQMGAVYETLNERDATIKNMQVRMQTADERCWRKEVRGLRLHVYCARRIHACFYSARTILAHTCGGVIECTFSRRICIDCALFLSFRYFFVLLALFAVLHLLIFSCYFPHSSSARSFTRSLAGLARPSARSSHCSHRTIISRTR